VSAVEQVPGFTSEQLVRERRLNGGLSVRRLAMRLLLASLGMLFAAGLVAHLVIRVRSEAWPPEGSPGLPGGLWSSTLLLFVLSLVLVAAVRAARGSKRRRARRLLAAAGVLGFGFLLSQAANWTGLIAQGFVPRESLFAFAFYVLTFLHGVHVIGGLPPLAVTAVRAGTGRYDGDTEPVELVASYWHFLGITWLAIFAVLALP
jgi:cytochrome c oxidase subunit 3